MEDQKQDSDTSHYGGPSSSEICNQSMGKLHVNTVEGGAQLINYEVDIILTPELDDNNGNNKVLDESINTYQRKKRRKSTELPDLTSDLGFLRQDTCSSLLSMDQRVRNNSIDQSVEFESVPPCCSENISDKRVIAEEKMSAEVDEMKSLEEDLACSLGSQKTSSGNNNGVLIGETDERSKKHNVDMLGGNNLEELHNEANDVLRILDFREENISNGPSLPSYGDAPMYHEEQCVASEADLSLKLLDDSKGVAADRTSTGNKVKKLLVLDVNGLLVNICPYVPYGYDPDDIIMKKAVFKRPHCDDFLKFCFEKFNVGIWTSRTKSNIEPILDLLLGNDTCKLLFCWDQSHCTNTGFTTVEKRDKPLLLKKLKKLWDKYDPDLPWEKGVYNESNTLLLDDTPYKALSNPRYTAVFPYTYHFKDVGDNSLGPGGDLRVYLEGLAVADDVQEYVKQNTFGQRAITEKNLSWGYYRKVIEASSTPPRGTEEDES